MYGWVMSHTVSHVWMSHVSHCESCMDESCLTLWVSHVSCMDESCLTLWVSHVEYCFGSHTHTHTHIHTHTHTHAHYEGFTASSQTVCKYESCLTYGWVMSHMWVSHAAHGGGVLSLHCRWRVLLQCVAVCCSVLQCVAVCCNLSLHCRWRVLMRHVSHVSLMNESCLIWFIGWKWGCCTLWPLRFRWYVLEIYVSHVSYVNASWNTCEWVMSHTVWAFHHFVADEMYLQFTRVMSDIWKSHASDFYEFVMYITN